jgi:CRP-like cAMP-binding protein
MNEPKLLGTLRWTRFFEGVAARELSELAAIGQLERYPAGTAVFQEGKPTNQFFVVTEGLVSLEITAANGTAKRIHSVGPGELLGWSPLLGGGAMKATARTLVDTRLVSFDATQTMALCERAPGLGFTLLRQVARALADRLHATRLHMLEICHHQLPDVVPLGSHEGAD